MRFAGNKIEDFFGTNRPDYGKTAQNAAALRSNEKTAATGLMGELGATGIGAQAKAKAAGITAAAQAQLGQAQVMGQAYSSIGSSIAGGIGSMPTGGGLQGTGHSMSGVGNFNAAPNMDFSASTPSFGAKQYTTNYF